MTLSLLTHMNSAVYANALFWLSISVCGFVKNTFSLYLSLLAHTPFLSHSQCGVTSIKLVAVSHISVFLSLILTAIFYNWGNAVTKRKIDIMEKTVLQNRPLSTHFLSTKQLILLPNETPTTSLSRSHTMSLHPTRVTSSYEEKVAQCQLKSCLKIAKARFTIKMNLLTPFQRGLPFLAKQM